MSTRKTCDRCKHYTPSNDMNDYRFAGGCALMLYAGDSPTPVDGVRPWDTESYWASAYVGPKFGCIHWIAIQPPAAEDAEDLRNGGDR